MWTRRRRCQLCCLRGAVILSAMGIAFVGAQQQPPQPMGGLPRSGGSGGTPGSYDPSRLARQQQQHQPYSPYLPPSHGQSNSLSQPQQQPSYGFNLGGGYDPNANAFGLSAPARKPVDESSSPSSGQEQSLTARLQHQQQQQQQQFSQHSSKLLSPQPNEQSKNPSPNTSGGFLGAPYLSAGPSAQDGGAIVEVQLKAYSNPERRIGPGQLCACPVGSVNPKCTEQSPSRSGYTCLFAFSIAVGSADDSVPYKFTSEIPLNSFGQISPEYTNIFQQPFEFQLDSQPTSLNVWVTSLGTVINAETGAIESTNSVTQVDSFVKSLNDTKSYSGGGGAFSSTGAQQQASLIGTRLGTQLTLSYSVACRGKLLGPGCDLSCNKSSVNTGSAICVNAKTGFFSLCRWTAGNTQVTECKNCPWGIKENAYCRDENGGVLDTNHAGVVSEGYRTSTVVLAVLCGLLAACLVVTCIFSCLRNRQRRNHPTAGGGVASTRSPPGYNHNPSQTNTSYLTHAGDAEATTALTSTAAPMPAATRYQHHHQFNGAPQPVPRSGQLPAAVNAAHYSQVPSLLNANKPKPPPLSSSRSPVLYQLPPPAHLGGGASLNESIAGSVVAPSVSADV